jgi:hypothetical protein
MHLKPVIAMLFFTASMSLLSQVAPAAKEGGWPFVVGAAFSDFSTDMFSKHMQGPTVWADWNPNRGPSFLRGFGVEAEGRDLDSGQPQGQQLRQVTAGGGPIYTWHYSRNFHPYGKFLFDYGAMDHIKDPRLPPSYTADKWIIYACGGGAEYRAWRKVWIRADYEYQFWKVELFPSNGFLNPQGFSVGVSYDFSHPRPR